jgi:alpha-L-fucosidase
MRNFLLTLAALTFVPAVSVTHSAVPARPTPEQVAWHDTEIGMFIHFAPNTWQDLEGDDLSTPLANINPAKLDTDQWVRVAEAMGARYIVFVAKHSGGFCMWQTDTTDYGIKNTSWRDGKGDVLGDLSQSCRKRGMRLGAYLSPQDHKHGIGSGGRARSQAEQEKYDRIYRQQLTEVLGKYGEMFEVWFDGSTVTDVNDIVHKYAPKAMVFQGPCATLRWVGTESGTAPYPNWNSLATRAAKSGVATATQGDPDGSAWMPNECDARMRENWFWNTRNARTLKSVKELLDMYYASVGRGAVLLLNNTPDTTGLIPATDAQRAAEFGAEVKRRFGKSLGETKGVGDTVELDLGKPTTINHVITMEDIAQGERVRQYVIEGLKSDAWQELAQGISIGHKKIDLFPPVEVSKIRLRVTKTVDTPQIRKLAAYNVTTVQ